MSSIRAGGIPFIALPVMLSVMLLLSACAERAHPHPSSAPGAERAGQVERATERRRSAANGDPYERFNRWMFKVNMTLDRYLMRPVAWTWRTILPNFIERMISNGFANAGMPLVIINSLLQGNLNHAGKATERFLVNSTLGIGGLTDPATRFGIEKVDEDFGQTLAVWGLDDGPYLVLPFLGPSNPRDALGFVVDSFGDPFMITMDKLDVHNLQLSLTAGKIADARARHWDDVNTLLEASDPYALARSAYRQRRHFLITNGRAEQTEEEEEIFEQDFDDFSEDSADEPEGEPQGSGGKDAGKGPGAEAPRTLARVGFVSPRRTGDDCVLLARAADCATIRSPRVERH